MEKPFEVGDRIRVYSHYGPYTATVTKIGVSRDILKGYVDGLVEVRSEDGNTWLQHPKQCRRLVKKKRREFWFNFYGSGGYSHAYFSREAADIAAIPNRLECIKVREVRE